MGRRVLLSLVALAVGAGLFAAVGLGSAARTRGATLRWGRPLDIDSLDPAIAYLPESWQIEFATCARLYGYPDRPAPEGATVVPEVAAGFPELSKDGKTQTIELKRTYRFDTGARITAANFVAAFNRGANPRLKSPMVSAGYLHEVVGADAVARGKAQTVSGVRTLGPYSLQIRTTRPLHDLASRLTTPFFCPVPVNMPAQEVNTPPGSGPYSIASRVPNREIVLTRNPYYRGPRQAHVERVVMTIGVAPEACRQAVEQDELDFCTFIPPGDWSEIADEYGINRPNGRLFFSPTLQMNYFAFNHDRPAFKGVEQIPLKQAINLVVDRHELARAAGFLSGRRTDQILPAALGRDEHIYPLRGVSAAELSRARALVAKAKFKPPRLVLYASTSGVVGVDQIWAQTFRYDMGRIGIDVDVKYFSSVNDVIARAGTRGEPFDVAIAGWVPDYPDGVAYFGPLLDGDNLADAGNSNLAYFDRPRYNRAIERIDSLTGEARRRAWADLDTEMMRDDPPWIPFLNQARRDFVSKSFGCYVLQTATGRLDLVAACKK